MNNISNKNHMYGCKLCEFCSHTELKREQYPQMSLTVWTCKKCESEHFWKWNNENLLLTN